MLIESFRIFFFSGLGVRMFDALFLEDISFNLECFFLVLG